MSGCRIAFLDDDHVLRLARYALCGPGDITDDWVRAFFAPEPVVPHDIHAIGAGLHREDGVDFLPLSASATEIRASDPTILVFRRGTVDAERIAAAPSLKLIQRLGARSDGIDLVAAAARGVAVSCLPRASLSVTAEHGMLLMLALGKKLFEADARVRAADWDRALVMPVDKVAYNWAGLTGLTGLHGRTLGIIGLGEVGTLMAGMARAFGMRVLYCNRNRLPLTQEATLGVRFAERGELLAQADFVSVNAANLPANRGMIDLATFRAMKRSAYFINTSRGGLVDEDALYTALTTGLIAGAGLDVHAEEPRVAGDRLLALPNLILTPHLAAGSRFAIVDELKQVFDNCRAVLAGGKPLHGA